MENFIDRLGQEYPEEYGNLNGIMKQACMIKFRDIITETVAEYSRKSEFVRIFPAKNSKIYDKYFNRSSLNKIIYKVLFTSEFVPYGVNLSELSTYSAP